MIVLEVGSRIAGERAFYPGLDLMADTASDTFYHHLDGTPTPISNAAAPMTTEALRIWLSSSTQFKYSS